MSLWAEESRVLQVVDPSSESIARSSAFTFFVVELKSAAVVLCSPGVMSCTSFKAFSV
jgi:hypothetical protein